MQLFMYTKSNSTIREQTQCRKGLERERERERESGLVSFNSDYNLRLNGEK